MSFTIKPNDPYHPNTSLTPPANKDLSHIVTEDNISNVINTAFRDQSSVADTLKDKSIISTFLERILDIFRCCLPKKETDPYVLTERLMVKLSKDELHDIENFIKEFKIVADAFLSPKNTYREGVFAYFVYDAIVSAKIGLDQNDSNKIITVMESEEAKNAMDIVKAIEKHCVEKNLYDAERRKELRESSYATVLVMHAMQKAFPPKKEMD